MSQFTTWISNVIFVVVFCSVTEGENVIVRFVDIGGIVNHHCLNFVYITLLMNKDFTIYQNIQTSVKICKKMCELMLIHPSVRGQNTCMRHGYLQSVLRRDTFVFLDISQNLCIRRHGYASSNYQIYFNSLFQNSEENAVLNILKNA